MFEESEEKEWMRGALLINGICEKNSGSFDFKFNACKQDNVTATKQNKKQAVANSLY